MLWLSSLRGRIDRAALTRQTVQLLLMVVILGGGVRPARAAEEHLDWPLRGRSLTLTVYKPARAAGAKGTVIMGSGDVGWVGLAVTLSQHLSSQGYLVIGINARQYLAAFTSGREHLTPADVQRDYGTLAEYLRGRRLLTPPVVASGVSEGAALAVLAGSAPANHAWLAGVATLGLPTSAEIAWRWSDFTTWLTKKDADEPSFAPADYLAAISPLPLVMIQSTKDEYVTAAEARSLLAAAREPKRQVLINASNHRFTDRMPEVQAALLAAVASMAAAG